MFNRKPANNSRLDEAINDAFDELKGQDAHSEDYSKIVEQITALSAIRDNTTDRFSKDTMLLVIGNLAGILLIINHENVNVITSKALPFVGKFR